MHYFTSITANYLPKARVLAASVRNNCTDVFFTLLISDNLPDGFVLDDEPFDQVLFIEDLDIKVDNLHLWIFTHTLVELCTAVKGAAIYKLLEESTYDKIIYLDPDIAVFGDLAELSRTLDSYDIVLTPHQCVPEDDEQAIINNEICSLQHGIYNLGFIAVKRSENAFAFARWWKDRLTSYCFADIPRGIFTDQRWCDFVPAFFDGVRIEKSCAYNVSTWNLTHRKITCENGIYLVNGVPLQFYHFSGFDSGAQKVMLSLYGNSKELWDLRNWYIKMQEANGQSALGSTECKYSRFSNGKIITDNHRRLLRGRNDILDKFRNSNPFIVDESKDSYYDWYEANKIDITDEKDMEIMLLKSKILLIKKYLSPLLWIRRVFLRITRK